MFAIDVQPGDQIRVVLNGTAKTVYNDAVGLDIILEGRRVVYEIPLDSVIVTKKAAPPEPPIGSIIQYYASDKYIRLNAAGWSYLPTVPGERLGSIPCKWAIFDHSAVKVLHTAEPKKSVF